MTPIRVLRVITRMNVGGPARQITSLWRGLDPKEFTQRILAGEAAAGEADYISLAAADVEVERIPGLRRVFDPLGDLRAFPALAREIRAFRPDVVHTHLTKGGLLGRAAAWTVAGQRIPTVHTFHGHVLYGVLSPAATRVVTELERRMASRTTRLVSVGARVRDELLAAGIGRPGQFEVVPPGIDLRPAPDPAVAKHTMGVPPGRALVTMVGRLSRQKCPDRFIEIARMAAVHHVNATFGVVGGGDLEPELRSLAAGLDNVRFFGWRGDIETVMAASDVVVLTSDNEGMPVALIEAGMAGRPTVAPDVGSTGEVVVDGETGLVTPADTESLAAAVFRLVRDPDLRARFGAQAETVCREKFSAARLVEDMARIYRTVVAPPG